MDHGGRTEPRERGVCCAAQRRTLAGTNPRRQAVNISRGVDDTPRRTIATTDTYEDAQALVDRLADDGFPVEHVTIVGSDVRLVEQVTGHLNAWRAALYGAASGASLGALFGVIFGLIFSPDGVSLLAIFLYWLIVGAVIGAIFNLITYALLGGRRNFTSVAGLRPSRYDVMVDEPFAAEAVRRLVSSAAVATARSR
jgi:hypothetical protein